MSHTRANRILNLIIIFCLLLIIGRIVFWCWGILSQKMLINDSALFAEMTRTLLDPTRTLYVDLWDHKPPVLFFFTAPFIIIFGTSTIAIQLAGLIEAMFFSFALAIFVKHITPERSAKIAVIVMTLYYGLIIIYTRGIETTILMATLGTVAIYLSLTAQGRLKRLFLSGILFVFAILSKQPIVTNALILPLAILISAPKREYFKSFFALISGGVIGTAFFVLWGLWNGNLFQLWEFAFGVNVRYSVGSDNHWIGSLNNFFDSVGWYYLARESLIMILPLCIFAAAASYRLWRINSNRRLLILLWLWVLTAIPGAMIGRTFKISYFYQLIPPLIIIIAWSIPFIRHWKRSIQALLIILLSSVLIITPTKYLQAMQIFQKQANDSEGWFQVIDFLKSHTEPTDCIWVWGYANQVNYYTNRAKCGALPHEGPVMLEDGFDINKYRPEYLQDLFKNKPTYHVNTSSWSYFPMLERFAERYRRERVKGLAYPVFRMDMSSWHERTVHFEDMFNLMGVDEFQGTEVCKGDKLHYATTWRVNQPPGQYYQMFVQLRDLETNTSYSSLDIPPSKDYPTQDWNRSGEIVLGDIFELSVPEDIPAGDYYIALGFYDTETLDRINIWDEQNQVIGSEIQLTQLNVLDECTASS